MLYRGKTRVIKDRLAGEVMVKYELLTGSFFHKKTRTPKAKPERVEHINPSKRVPGTGFGYVLTLGD